MRRRSTVWGRMIRPRETFAWRVRGCWRRRDGMIKPSRCCVRSSTRSCAIGPATAPVVTAELGELLIKTAEADTPRQDEGLRINEEALALMN